MYIDFNKKNFERLLKLKIIKKHDSILVIGGLKDERDFFIGLNFKNVTISNIYNLKNDEVNPYKFIKQDVNNLTFDDNYFDFVFVSASLHHSSSPVCAVLEMYRVAKKGIVLTEVRDSIILKLGQKLRMIPEYEIAAVVDNDFLRGGVNNTEIPNYVYRWTERELKKIVSSFNPTGKHKFLFFYKFAPSFLQDKILGHKARYYLLKTIATLIKPLTPFLKKQGNIFSAVILKPRAPEDLFPWLKLKTDKKIVFNRDFRG